MKLVKENLSEHINESIRFSDAYFDKHNLSRHENVYAGQKGILGANNTIIPWSFIKKLLDKYEIS